MLKAQEKLWLNELKIDFPQYSESIDLLGREVEQFLELAEDYYFCKAEIKALEKSGGSTLLYAFTEVFEDLREEIRLMILEREVNLHYPKGLK